MQLNPFYLAAAAVLVSSASLASANTVSYSASLSPSDGDTALDSNLPQFDPSLGTLTGVTVAANTSAAAVAVVYSFNANPDPYTMTSISANTTVTDPFDSTNKLILTSTLGSVSGTVSSAGPNVVGTGTPVTGTLTSTVASANFGSFQGSGTSAFDFPLALLISSSGSAGFGATGGDVNFSGSTADVTYTYSPVPEPTSIAMVGIGGIALLLRRRRAVR